MKSAFTSTTGHGIDIEMSSRTAINRKRPSYPLLISLSHGLIKGLVIDYGCGHGADVKYLNSIGYKAVGYDPNFFPDRSVLKDSFYDTALNFYVLNVVFPETRIQILKDIKRILKSGGSIVVAVRDVSEKIEGKEYLDGVMTAKNTFQKTFTDSELIKLLNKFFYDVKIILKSKPLMAYAKKR